MAETFDPYYKWLGIGPEEQPPHHYRLLGLRPLEPDPEVIDAAANRQMAYLQQRAVGPHAAISQKLLNEMSAARLCLLNPETKSQYDRALQEKLAALSGFPPEEDAGQSAPIDLDLLDLDTASAPRREARPGSAGGTHKGAASHGLARPSRGRWSARRQLVLWLACAVLAAVALVIFVSSSSDPGRQVAQKSPTDVKKRPKPETSVWSELETEPPSKPAPAANRSPSVPPKPVADTERPLAVSRKPASAGEPPPAVSPKPGPAANLSPTVPSKPVADTEFPLAVSRKPTSDAEPPPAVSPKPASGDEPPAISPKPASEPELRPSVSPKPARGNSGTADAATLRHVGMALVWFARHQSPDGRWSLLDFQQRCKDRTCTGVGDEHLRTCDAGATALALLPFLGASPVDWNKGPYQRTIRGGLGWLLHQQRLDGDLAFGAQKKMYSHALATIALCEAFRLSKDRQLRLPAQKAVQYVVRAQNQQTGGWWYEPGKSGDTCVVGWQLAALRSAQAAGFKVAPSALAGAGRWLDSCVKSPDGSRYCYAPGQEPRDSMTAVGLRCRQYLGADLDSDMMLHGIRFLTSHQPDLAIQPGALYCDYFASQVIHCASETDWEAWSPKIHTLLFGWQNTSKECCAFGSWDPERVENTCKIGGRLLSTSLATLTLEVELGNLSIFK